VTWADVDWLRSIAGVPLLLKGILDPDDAGGPSITAPTASSSPTTAHGISTPSPPRSTRCRASPRACRPCSAPRRRRHPPRHDVVKALALGGRLRADRSPLRLALAAAGADGVARVVTILRQDLETSMALLGRKRIADLDAGVLWTLWTPASPPLMYRGQR